jgi:CRISPR system Cascade subunit CasC
MFVEIHVIHPLSTHPNRGLHGAPKTIPWGGTLRPRVSSQCWKRAIKEHLEKQFTTSTQTRKAVDVVTRIWKNVQGHEAVSEESARAIFATLISETLSKVDEGQTVNTLCLGYEELEKLVSLVREQLGSLDLNGGNLSDLDPDTLLDFLKENGSIDSIAQSWRSFVAVAPVPIDIALTGRMVAVDPDNWQVEAALAVSQAVGTHRMQNEIDYFAALDEEEGRASFLGTKDLQTAVFYRNLVLDLHQLSANLGGDIGLVKKVVGALIESLKAVPSGGMSNSAHYNRPEFVMVVTRDTLPLSALAAFDQPVRAGREGLIAASISRLEQYVVAEETAWGEQIEERFVLAPRYRDLLSDLQPYCVDSIQSVADQVVVGMSL